MSSGHGMSEQHKQQGAEDYGNPGMHMSWTQEAHGASWQGGECPFRTSEKRHANPDVSGAGLPSVKRTNRDNGTVCTNPQEPCSACRIGRMCEGFSDDEETVFGAHHRNHHASDDKQEETYRTAHVWRSFSRRTLDAHGLGASITSEQLMEHRTDESFWLAAHGNVYDITSYLSRHPSGKDTILRNARADNSEDFEFHSKFGQDTWKRHKIGRLVSAARDLPAETSRDATSCESIRMACGMTQEGSSGRCLQGNQVNLGSV
jgi:cytochrome b involved in lipid metabolism